jgi:hypothetical protein
MEKSKNLDVIRKALSVMVLKQEADRWEARPTEELIEIA